MTTKLTARRRQILRALAEGAYIDVWLSLSALYETYGITWVPDFYEANVTKATVELFKQHGWAEEVDGNFSGSVLIITDAGRQYVASMDANALKTARTLVNRRAALTSADEGEGA